jgi:PAS domain-containing protein
MTSNDEPAERRRLVLAGKGGAEHQEAVLVWAARQGLDALVLPLEGSRERLTDLAGRYAMEIEAGGRELSALLPRRLFFFHRELFRMEQGRREQARHFCATSPDTINRIKKRTQKLFGKILKESAEMGRRTPAFRVFHLWPDRDFETLWCACPSCRAFSPTEQYRIALNAAADVLGELDPDAKLSYWEPAETDDAGESAEYIALRANIFPLKGEVREIF